MKPISSICLLIKLTFLANLTSCLVMFFYYLMVDQHLAFLVLFFSFGNLFVPTLIGVLGFRLIRKKLIRSNPFRTIAFQTCVMSIIFLIGILIWAKLDVLLFGTLRNEHWNVEKEFNSEFKIWLPALFSLSFFIPYLDHRFSKADRMIENNPNPIN